MAFPDMATALASLPDAFGPYQIRKAKKGVERMRVAEEKQIHSAVDGDYTIYLEDWSKDYPSVYSKNDHVAAYPTAKNSHYYGSNDGYAYPRRGQAFRLGMHFPSEAEARAAIQALEAGTKTLADYVEVFDSTPNTRREDFAYCLK